MAKKKKCDVIVGNVGYVRRDIPLTEARKVFNEYVADSKSGTGRAGNEEVTLMCDGEILDDFIPESQENED